MKDLKPGMFVDAGIGMETMEKKILYLEAELNTLRQVVDLLGLCHPDMQVARIDLDRGYELFSETITEGWARKAKGGK
jgi:hypothetical protein